MGASIKVLTHLALLEFERAILIVIVRGTDKTIPTGPKTQPQNNNDKKTTKFKFNDLDLCKLKPNYNKLIKEYSNAK